MSSIRMFVMALMLLYASVSAGRSKIYHSLLMDYDKGVLPEGGPVTVNQAFYLSSIEVDEVKQYLTVTARIITKWQDTRLSWTDVNGNMSYIAMPAERVWIPDIVHANAVKPETVIIAPSVVDLSVDGTVVAVKQVRMTSFCNLTEISDGTYLCEMVFQSWMYYGDDILLLPLRTQYILQNYEEIGRWIVRNATARKNAIELLTGTQLTVVYSFQLEKSVIPEDGSKNDTSVDVSALPLVFLGFMAPLQFLIPLESSERLTFDGFLVLAGTVIAVAGYDALPTVQLPRSVLSYSNYILTLVFLCILLTILNLQICTSLGKRLPVLDFLKRGLFSGANRLVFVAVPKARDMRVKRPHVIIEHRMEDLSNDEATLESPPEVFATIGRDSEQLTEIVDILVPLAEERGRCENEARLRQDWLTVGLIIDRLLFVLFLLVFVFCSLGFMA